MTEKTDEKNGSPLLGIGAMVLAILIGISGVLGHQAAQLQGNLAIDRPSQNITVFYWAVLFYNNVSIPLTGLILLLVLILIGVIIDSIKQQTNAPVTWSSITLSVLALTIAVLSIFPVLFVSYEHVTSARFDGHRYNLGLSLALDNDNFYVICKCDFFGIFCDCYAVGPAYSDFNSINRKNPSRAIGLQQDAKTKIIYITTKDKKILISK